MNLFPSEFATYSPLNKLRVQALYTVVCLVILQGQISLATRVIENGLSFTVVLFYCAHIFLVLNVIVVKISGVIKLPSLFISFFLTLFLSLAGYISGPFESTGFYWLSSTIFLCFILSSSRINWALPILTTAIYIYSFFFYSVNPDDPLSPEKLNSTSATNTLITIVIVYLVTRKLESIQSINKVIGFLVVSYLWVLTLYHWTSFGFAGQMVVPILIATAIFFPKFLKVQFVLLMSYVAFDLVFDPLTHIQYEPNRIKILLLNTPVLWLTAIGTWYIIKNQKPKVSTGI